MSNNQRREPILAGGGPAKRTPPTPTGTTGANDPEHDPGVEALRAAVELLARILDAAIRVPGTRIHIGLDPLIGLIPGLGDALASLIGSAILVMAVRLRVPRIVLARMCLNLLLNGVLGAIPGVGDAFSVWFQSNVRNAALLRRASETSRRPSTFSDWAFVVGLLAGTLGLLLAAILGILWLVSKLWHLAP